MLSVVLQDSAILARPVSFGICLVPTPSYNALPAIVERPQTVGWNVLGLKLANLLIQSFHRRKPETIEICRPLFDLCVEFNLLGFKSCLQLRVL